MRLKCPHCLHNVDVDEPVAREPIACPDCGEWIRGNNSMVPVQRSRTVSRPVRREQFVYDPYEEEEEREERREERLYRDEEREDTREARRDGKVRNVFAIAGLCVVLPCLLLVVGGLLFHRQLPVYLLFALVLSVPGSLAGLALSLVGLFVSKAMRPLAIAGVGIGGALLLLLVPLGFLVLKF